MKIKIDAEFGIGEKVWRVEESIEGEPHGIYKAEIDNIEIFLSRGEEKPIIEYSTGFGRDEYPLLRIFKTEQQAKSYFNKQKDIFEKKRKSEVKKAFLMAKARYKEEFEKEVI